MPIITSALRFGQTGARIKALQDELRALGSVLAEVELGGRLFGETTRQAVVEFQTQADVEPTGIVDKVTGRLMTSAVEFANEGPTVKVRQDLRQALQADSNAPVLAIQLARYELLAGDYGSAHELVLAIPDFPGMARLIERIVGLPDPLKPPRPPEVPYPANFYTYRHTLINVGTLARMREELRNQDDSKFKIIVGHLLDVFEHWNLGNDDFNRGLYARAIQHYDACQTGVIAYFQKQFDLIDLEPQASQEQLVRLISILSRSSENREGLWSRFARRRSLLSLEELFAHDWGEPGKRFSSNASLTTLGGVLNSPLRESELDAPLITLAYIFVPLARAEVNRLRRQFEAAILDCRWVFEPIPVEFNELVEASGDLTPVMFARLPGSVTPTPTGFQLKLIADFIEGPFARLLLAQIFLDRADAEYKARMPADPQVFEEADKFQNLKAAQTYLQVQKVLEREGAYLSRVRDGTAQIESEIEEALSRDLHPLLADTTAEQRRTLQTLGKDLPVATVNAIGNTLPGFDRRAGPHESLVTFSPPPGEQVLKETNPLIYALILEAEARLFQISSGFNYLGYRDDYVPPWRFQFLLERARYYSEHAKNAQREYLNFLGNAEREEFQELSVAQSVELEKSNIRIETARVEQTQLEVEASKLSQELATLTADNAEKRFNEYQKFDEFADEITNRSTIGGGLLKIREGLGSALGDFGTAVADIGIGLAGRFGFGGDDASREIQEQITARQREFEKFNLQLVIGEAELSADIAQAQLDAAKAGLVVAGMQRAAAILRHEFAVQSLDFLRNRTLSSELWYRLAGMIRSISNAYMRYAVELAFLTEQAYEFEADKRINVIRFDYDVSEIGSLLAADFLLRDLDTLEQDLIVNQRQRQQQVRYVLSLAREFPEALQDLRDNGSTLFSLRLEQLERRFPGLYNLRLGAVDISPVALMDPTRFSLEMTYLGSSQVRLKAQPDTPPGVDSQSPLNTNDLTLNPGDWLAEAQREWPVKIRVTAPEATVFSGLTRQEASAVFPFASAGQRNAFETLGAAAGWRIDMSMKENQVVPGSLADLLITFTLTGYHDPDLRAAVDNAPRGTQILTQFISARQRFPDAFYEFSQSGRMIWDVTENMLSIDAPVRNLRNLGILLVPVPRQVQFSALMSSYVVELDVIAGDQLDVLTPVPELTIAIDQLQVTVSVSGSAGATVSLNFGEGDGFQSATQHLYRQPGEYEMGLRLVQDSRLYEFKAEIAVSRTQTFIAPLTAFPSFDPVPQGQTGILARTNKPVNEDVTVIWRVDQNQSQRGSETLLDLPPGKHVVQFTALRNLQARIHSQQRFVPEQSLEVDSLHLSTNRVFELDGSEKTGVAPNDVANALTEHLFPENLQTNERLPLSPADRWTLEILVDDNPFLRSATPSDNPQVDLEGIDDAILILEYETGIS